VQVPCANALQRLSAIQQRKVPWRKPNYLLLGICKCTSRTSTGGFEPALLQITSPNDRMLMEDIRSPSGLNLQRRTRTTRLKYSKWGDEISPYHSVGLIILLRSLRWGGFEHSCVRRTRCANLLMPLHSTANYALNRRCQTFQKKSEWGFPRKMRTPYREQT